jgi:hypothetical protein
MIGIGRRARRTAANLLLDGGMKMPTTTQPRRSSDRLAPQFVDLTDRTLAVVHTRGDPNVMGPKVLPALYEIAGPHEEEYLTRPDAKVPKTIIRYAVRPARGA